MDATIKRNERMTDPGVAVPVCSTVVAAAVAGSTAAAVVNRNVTDTWGRRACDWICGILVAAYTGPSICAMLGLVEEHHRAACIFATGLIGVILATMALDIAKSERFKSFLASRVEGKIP